MSSTSDDLPRGTTFAALGDTFGTLLSRVRPAIESRLARLWAAKLESLRRHGPEVLTMAAAARDLTLRGGKRYRAALLAAAYGGLLPDAPIEPALQAGLALELLQTYLLIQDDWMDGDNTRRGGPSVHAALASALGDHLGAGSAMLSSDLTFGMAFHVLTHIEAPASALVETIRAFAKMNEDVVIGQQIDLLGHAEDVEAMHDLKTGSYTVRGPLNLGATLAGASAETLAAFERFAGPVGVAFQLRDDLLSTFGTSSQTGKPVGNDLRAGKRTAIIMEAEGRLDAEGRAALARAHGNASASAADVIAATHALEACGAKMAVVDRLCRLCDDAESMADRLPVAPTAKRILAGSASALRPKLEDTWGSSISMVIG
ncbi:MAG: polyprenyl synthetase family protein [Byssovorax sp.]